LSDEEEEDFNSSMPSLGRVPRKSDRHQVESDHDSANESNPNYSPDEEGDSKKNQPSNETNPGLNNGKGLNQTDILSLLQLGAAAGTFRFTVFSNNITSETKRWIMSASQNKRGGNKVLSPQLQTALENQHISGVVDSIQWAMEDNYRRTGTCTLQESTVTSILQNKIAWNTVISDLTEIATGLSIALVKPANKEYSNKKGKGGVQIFIPETASELLNQLEIYEALLSVLLTKESYAFYKCSIIRKQFEEHYQFLHSQFGKYKGACGEHIIKALHNTFNNFFVKVKRDRKFIPSGIKLSLLDRIEEGEDLNLVAQFRKRDRDNDYNNSNKRGNRNKNNSGNQNMETATTITTTTITTGITGMVTFKTRQTNSRPIGFIRE
jgi:hypothetical protein